MIRVTLVIALVISATTAAGHTSPGPPIIGRAIAIDGDTLAIGGTRVRLWGIDAPEASQSCTRARRSWPCGQASRAALAWRINAGLVACRPLYHDRGGRPVARCEASGRDLSADQVSAGWALDYPYFSNRAF